MLRRFMRPSFNSLLRLWHNFSSAILSMCDSLTEPGTHNQVATMHVLKLGRPVFIVTGTTAEEGIASFTLGLVVTISSV